MRNMILGIFVLGLLLFTVKVPVLAQDQDVDIRCELSGLDLNLSGKPDYLIDFGSFSLIADGEEVKEEKGGTMITRFYKIPQTKLILSVFVAYTLKNESFGEKVIAQQMILGKKRFSITSPEIDEETRYLVSSAFVVYPVKAFDEEGKGVLSMSFLGKKKPIRIWMKCKKEGS